MLAFSKVNRQPSSGVLIQLRRLQWDDCERRSAL